MNDTESINNQRSDVIERYCPKREENVIMRRTFGLKTQLKCMNYDNCENEKDDFCSGENGRTD